MLRWLYRLLNPNAQPPDPEVVEAFNEVTRALYDGDIPFLETYAARDSDFPNTDSAAVVNLLVEHGVDVNARGTLDVTPLYIAAANGSSETIKLLLRHGADPLACDSEYGPRQPIDCVDNHKRREIRELLLEAMRATKR